VILDFSSLKQSINNLKDALETFDKIASNEELKQDQKLENTLKSGIIQNFEVAYEMSWKIMKRWLENQVSREAVDGVPRRELFRIATENGLIDDIELWMKFHYARNESAHTYNAEVAEDVYSVSRDFLKSAENLAQRLEKKQPKE
jgi:nucleotidyltransferase substrate binding protein (TIGR01987 family)